MKELEAWGEQHQRQLHFQGFGRVPVDDSLAPVKDQFAKLAREQQLAAATIAAIATWQVGRRTMHCAARTDRPLGNGELRAASGTKQWPVGGRFAFPATCNAMRRKEQIDHRLERRHQPQRPA